MPPSPGMNAQAEAHGVEFAAATPALVPRIARLLGDAGLPAEDLGAAGNADFEVALDGEGRIVGVAGLEVCGEDALLRSVAVVPDWRGRGLGERLVARREAAARNAGVRMLYLLTLAATDFFRRCGYADQPRDLVPAAIAGHAQFQGLCPASAQCLGKRL
jgi:amino-acid N-acetyltransferase